MEKTTITLGKDTHKDLMLHKLNHGMKNVDEVIKLAIKKLKGELPVMEDSQETSNLPENDPVGEITI